MSAVYYLIRDRSLKQIIVIVFYTFIIITVTWYVTYQSYLESNGNTESVNIPQPRTLPQRDLPLRSPSPVESEKAVENEAKRVQPEHSNTNENNNSNNDDNDLAANLKLLHSTHQQLIDEHDELKADVNYYKQTLLTY